MQKTERHIPVLDAVRGIAILLVLALHITEHLTIPNGSPWEILTDVARSGWTGVDLFFVLSGFLITGILYDTRESTNYFRAFYMRRFLRIFPLYYGFLFILLCLTYPLHLNWNGTQYIYLAYLQNTGISKLLFHYQISPWLNFGHLWSLAVEEQFYCVWPAVIFLVKDRLKLIQVSILLSILSIIVRVAILHFHLSPWAVNIFTLARADSLMIGAILALLMRTGDFSNKKWQLASWTILSAGMISIILIAMPEHGLARSSIAVMIFGYTLLALISASIIHLSIVCKPVQRIVNQPILRWLGRYSYGIYILHFPILFALNHWRETGSHPLLDQTTLGQLLLPVSGAILSIGLAFLSFHFYESKFLALKKYFRYKFPEVQPQVEP
jgi:peptidoglycan/LPS O-acetylase OafA/YrhL